MKTLIAFYSNTGRTQAHMIKLMERLSGERLITIRAVKTHAGPVGFLRSGYEAMRKKTALIETPGTPVDMSDYDLVVLGTPVWAGQMSSPIRTFLQQYGAGIRRCAYVITHSGPEEYTSVFDELDKLTGVKRSATLSLSRDTPDADAKLDHFADTLQEDIL